MLPDDDATRNDHEERLMRIASLIGRDPAALNETSDPISQAVELLGLFQALETDKERQALLAFARRLARNPYSLEACAP